jgi:hypothetical protein
MNTQKLFRISGMVLLALAVSAVTLALVFAMQNPQVFINFAFAG